MSQGNSGSFPVTRWSLVGRAGAADAISRRAAIDELLRRYLPALRSHLVLRKRIPPDRADDLIQSFIANKILQQQLVAQADQTRGRFRTFLLTALDRFLVSEYRHARARKRSPAAGRVLSIDACDPTAGELEFARRLDPPDPAPTVDHSFDLDWARQLLSQALERLRRELESNGRADVWGVFEDRVLGPILEDRAPLPYEQLVSRYGLTSATQASNLLITAKRAFARVLRELIAEYEPDESAVDEEVADLLRILSQ